MTIADNPAVVEYLGNGIEVNFDYEFEVLEDSTVNAQIDGVNTTAFNLNTPGTVQFNTAPEVGAEITIYRVTKIHMPENYKPMGRFPGDKTELSMDRITAIMQEAGGINRGTGNKPGDRVVGSADLSVTRQEFSMTIVSERGTDAVLPLWNPTGDVPIPPDVDPSILWGGEVITGFAAETDVGSGFTSNFWSLWRTFSNTPEGTATAYIQDGTPDNRSWLDTIKPELAPGQYWARFRIISAPANFRVYGTDGSPEVDNVPFEPISLTRDYFSISLPVPQGSVAPFRYIADFWIDISADDGFGAPDGNWATSRITWTLDHIL